jgi:glycogen operon protein
VHGPHDPERGLRCNPNKLLIDPYAKAVSPGVDWDESLFGYNFDSPEERNDADSAGHVPYSLVVSPFFDWANDRPPKTPYNESVIYEAHVKGLTMTHPEIPDRLRGTYAGLAHPVIIDHLQSLGVTAIELMPVHQFVTDHGLVEKGLRNYWGYNTIGFFAPHDAYAALSDQGGQVQEFKGMVRAFHEANIEVILDVVYNHTAEGNHLGPTLSMRGIDNEAYYRLVDDEQKYYMDYTGTGNSLSVRHPHTLQLIMDSLRYWVTEMRVDGFRFDLAATLAREFYDVDRLSTFFDLVQQDPVVSQVKLIAEPWDVGPGGYQVGNFPPLWTEWNGQYRDTVRDFWRGKPATLGEFASRITGSSDLYHYDGRRPFASINFVTAHDGFTLTDLVSYNEKHNEANGENGRDGADDNRSWNCGVEGPTADPEITALRERQRRNLLATLLLSQGVPMLLHGDEIGRTQQGNNNAYCQDNELSWVDWSLAGENKGLVEFTAAVAGLRKQHPVFRRRRFFAGKPIRKGDELRDIAWFTPSGEEMNEQNWDDGFGRAIVVFLNGEGIPDLDQRGMPVVDDSFLMAFNAHDEDIVMTMPVADYGRKWTVVVDTATGKVAAEPGEETVAAGGKLNVVARSLAVLQRVEQDEP